MYLSGQLFKAWLLFKKIGSFKALFRLFAQPAEQQQQKKVPDRRLTFAQPV